MNLPGLRACCGLPSHEAAEMGGRDEGTGLLAGQHPAPVRSIGFGALFFRGARELEIGQGHAADFDTIGT